MQAKALVDKEDDNLPDVEAERHWDILGDVKAKGLASPLAVTLPVGGGGEVETLDKTNSYTVEQAVANRLGDTSPMWRTRLWSIRYPTLYDRRTLRKLATH